jgi:Cu2+-exporting ATPase
VFFANEQKVLACMALKDQIKPYAAEAIKQLNKAGIETYMLTGDTPATAAAVAAEAGLGKNFKAQCTPHSKAAFIKALQDTGKKVAMAGDGLNDTAALAQADMGIAMGNGQDIVLDIAPVTLVNGDLGKIFMAIQVSKHTMRTVRQNLFWAFIYNVAGIPLAAGILYPFTGFLLNPMIAGAAMALSSVSVVSNSLLLHKRRLTL